MSRRTFFYILAAVLPAVTYGYGGSLTALWSPWVESSLQRGSAPPEQFVYLSDQRIVTLELVDRASIIVNYINLSDTYELFDPKNIVLVDDQGNAHRGHLIKLDNPESSEMPYRVSELLKPDTITGYEIVGGFELKGAARTVLFRIGGRILELEPVRTREFDLIAARIGELDIQASEARVSLERAGFRRGLGRLIFAGTPEAAEYESYFPEAKIVPPVPLAAPQPRLPSSEAGLPDPVIIRVKAIVSRAGGLRNIEVLDGLSEKLNRIAVETVRNSWIFLPAIADSKISESEVVLRVVFRRNGEKPNR